ncbi:MAG: protein-disulfide reductase DsbD family protein [Aestuariivirga sp.]|nr:protein-disulfide reductase DsbD family protein [Aestuariivirga sp.]
MNRRQAILALAAAPLMATAARSDIPEPFKVSLISGGQEGGVWQAGILVELEPEWKTYWRMPGDSGIPPQFDWAGSENCAAIEVGFPVPRRFNDAAGETIGYHNRVVFPVFVRPEKLDATASLQLDMFFAVCKDVCIPAKAKAGAALSASAANPLLDEWLKRLPRLAAAGTPPFVTAARFETRENKPALVVTLTGQAQDIFVESETSAYFGKPRFDGATGEVWLPIANLRDTAKLRGIPLKLTLSTGDSGIEQTLTIT